MYNISCNAASATSNTKICTHRHRPSGRRRDQNDAQADCDPGRCRLRRGFSRTGGFGRVPVGRTHRRQLREHSRTRRQADARQEQEVEVQEGQGGEPSSREDRCHGQLAQPGRLPAGTRSADSASEPSLTDDLRRVRRPTEGEECGAATAAPHIPLYAELSTQQGVFLFYPLI